MWSELSKEQEEAERARLLYVALTRAEQMLLINGCVQQNQSGSLSWKGWLRQLAGVTGLNGADLSAYDEMGGEQHTFDYTLQETAVRATFYEPLVAAQKGMLVRGTDDTGMDRPLPSSLQEPVVIDVRSETAVDDIAQRAWQVIPAAQRPHAPAWIVGQLVHHAIALWRFSGAGFDDWVTARAREYGLTDQRRLRDARRKTARLLRQFQQSPLFQEIDKAAKRYHELPFCCADNGATKTGRIDLLYQHEGTWTIVDFKTDSVRDAVALQKLPSKTDYEEQLRQYGTAVRQLLGVEPRLLLCLLDCVGEVRLISTAAG
jgi:ATP-dependent exoDNAse (exonuclease V) beta subunit